MKKPLSRLLLLTVILNTVSIAAFSQIYVEIRPVVPVVVRTPAPDPSFIWIEEDWKPGPNGYKYAGGHWVRPPQRGYFWQPGHWKKHPSNNGQAWVPGRWSKGKGWANGRGWKQKGKKRH